MAANQTIKIGRAEEQELFGRWKEDEDIEARNRLVEGHIRTAHAVASRFQARRRYNKEDLISEAYIAVIEACDVYDPANPTGARFATFLNQFIEFYLMSSSKYVRGEVKIPDHFYEVPEMEDPADDPAHEYCGALAKEARRRIIEETIAECAFTDRDERIFRMRFVTEDPIPFTVLGEECGITGSGAHHIAKKVHAEFARKLRKKFAIDEKMKYDILQALS